MNIIEPERNCAMCHGTGRLSSNEACPCFIDRFKRTIYNTPPKPRRHNSISGRWTGPKIERSIYAVPRVDDCSCGEVPKLHVDRPSMETNPKFYVSCDCGAQSCDSSYELGAIEFWNAHHLQHPFKD